ncbi:hypothetical protein PR202_gb21614 [Eleusine coracana subsp. coracana]|uniref:Uncharacterized protein n=1 Tax=Eleusine coracana subsp. coracana TaxID=191504 RepID=A0AAV5FDM2_ELECO|nr:hypothetical protein PR202_gb21614 [Eleusine coracana subsp. coracana]
MLRAAAAENRRPPTIPAAGLSVICIPASVPGGWRRGTNKLPWTMVQYSSKLRLTACSLGSDAATGAHLERRAIDASQREAGRDGGEIPVQAAL